MSKSTENTTPFKIADIILSRTPTVAERQALRAEGKGNLQQYVVARTAAGIRVFYYVHHTWWEENSNSAHYIIEHLVKLLDTTQQALDECHIDSLKQTDELTALQSKCLELDATLKKITAGLRRKVKEKN